MALGATIHKAQVQVSDLDRNVWREEALTLAQHPSESAERMMVRLLAWMLHVPADDHDGALQFTRGLSDVDQPDLWQHALDGQLRHWIEIGQPDAKRLARASGRAERVTVLSYAASTPIWFRALEPELKRLPRLAVWQLDAAHSRALATLADRSMNLQWTLQEGQGWLSRGDVTLEIAPARLWPAEG